MKKNLILTALLSLALFPRAGAEDPGNKAAETATAAAEAPAPAPAIRVEKLAVGTAVVKRELIGESRVFPKETASVYVWTKLKADNPPCAVNFVYYLNGKKVREITLNVKFSTYRTWTIKNVSVGDWKVELQDENGAVLASAAFLVTEGTPPAAGTEPEEKK
ncbi:MAG: hypothetical protein COT17_08355 [Elusimicrobia bacterium CG08_land_8_20_14_0_20_51_18]|nr:MAG: hypothetical protein COT17_08355 [Elusimicrobia bacterium CG08_land_8_20_14_0_20_51_18]